MYTSRIHLRIYCLLWTNKFDLQNCAVYKDCTATIPQFQSAYYFQNIPRRPPKTIHPFS